MRTGVISAVGHVALQVADLDRAVEMSTTIMGLRVARRDERSADLTHGACHHSLQYIQSDVDALDHVGLEAPDGTALAEARTRLRQAGARMLSEKALDPELADGFVFELPGGIPVEVYSGMPQDQPDYVASGVRPRRFGHINLCVEDPGAAVAVLTEALDFLVSDRVLPAAFLRCNNEHHGIGLLPGPRGLHHHAWEVPSVGEIGRLADTLFSAGDCLVEGPARHGVGGNVAAYFRGAAGEGVEYYTDMRWIDDENHTPGNWEGSDVTAFSQWTPRLPSEAFLALGAQSVLGLERLPAGLAADGQPAGSAQAPSGAPESESGGRTRLGSRLKPGGLTSSRVIRGFSPGP